jgi:hypothetical protein
LQAASGAQPRVGAAETCAPRDLAFDAETAGSTVTA